VGVADLPTCALLASGSVPLRNAGGVWQSVEIHTRRLTTRGARAATVQQVWQSVCMYRTSEIEPATLWFEAQCLNQLRHRAPSDCYLALALFHYLIVNDLNIFLCVLSCLTMH
jgi:hypothetical protein